MSSNIRTPEEVIPEEVLESIRENEGEFENFEFPDGFLKEGIIGDIAIITIPDYEYGYSYLMNLKGEKISLDFGDFLCKPNGNLQFKMGRKRPDEKDCFTGPYFIRLFYNGQPTEKIIYYGFWADCPCDTLDDELIKRYHPFDRLYVGGIIENGRCIFFGNANFEGFSKDLLNPHLILTKPYNAESEYYDAMYDEWEQESRDSFYEDPWSERNLYGVFDIKSGKQIVVEGVHRIEVKGEEIFLHPTKYAETQRFFPKHPKRRIECFQSRLDQLPEAFDPWRPQLIESPNYFGEEHGMINIAPYAGIDIYDLITENRQLLLSLVRRNYFHLDTGVIECWQEEYEDSIPHSYFEKLYIANDAHHLYTDIVTENDRLEILGSSVYVYSEFHRQMMPLHTCLKHEGSETFINLLLNDFHYIEALIRLKRVYVKSKLLESLQGVVSKQDKNKISSLINFVKSWESEIEEWQAEERDKEYSEYLSMCEDEDYDQMYRDAFDGNPDAEWNID